MDNQGIAWVLSELSPGQLAALTPFSTFSGADGKVLKQKGLLVERDGVWFHTPLGVKAREFLDAQRSAA